MKSLIMKGPILLFLVSNCLSKSKYYLVETDNVKLPTEIKNDDVNVNHQQRHHNIGMIDKELSYNLDIQPLMNLVKSCQKCLRYKVKMR